MQLRTHQGNNEGFSEKNICPVELKISAKDFINHHAPKTKMNYFNKLT